MESRGSLLRRWSATVDRTAEAGERVRGGGGGAGEALEAVAAQFEGIYNRCVLWWIMVLGCFHFTPIP